ncbi:MAG: hypothetical protein ACI9GK_001306, partial [Devosia sp.]
MGTRRAGNRRPVLHHKQKSRPFLGGFKFGGQGTLVVMFCRNLVLVGLD